MTRIDGPRAKQPTSLGRRGVGGRQVVGRPLVGRLIVGRGGGLGLGLLVAIAALLFLEDLGAISEAEAHPVLPGPAESRWQEGGPQLLARRRRRRRRRRRKPPTVRKKAPEPAKAEPAPAAAPSGPAPSPGNLRRGARVEFDGRLVQGQTAKSGAIYLFARKRSELRSMVKERKDYRKEILRTVYPGMTRTTNAKK